MVGPIIALSFAIILLTAIFLPPVLRRPWVDGTRRLLHRRITCPESGGEVDCTLERDDFAGSWSQVHRCSALGNVANIGCEQGCLVQLNRKAGPGALDLAA